MNSTKEQSNRGAVLAAGEDRRRSQRVIIHVPVTLVFTENGQSVRVSANTVAVNIHGAMIVCPRTIEADAAVEMINERTQEKVASRVTRAPRESSEGFLVPVEFTAPSPNFWQISFPPSNWKAPEN
jgi:hypothetical protein